MNKARAKELLVQDLEHKKAAVAFRDIHCWTCDMPIAKDDEFYFLARQGICNNCRGELVEMIEDNL